MSDAYVPRPKLRRRRRRSSGDEILDSLAKERPELERGKDRGLRCRPCGRWIPWKDLHAKYEHQSSDLCRLWICSRCSAVLRTDNLAGYEAYLEWVRREQKD